MLEKTVHLPNGYNKLICGCGCIDNTILEVATGVEYEQVSDNDWWTRIKYNDKDEVNFPYIVPEITGLHFVFNARYEDIQEGIPSRRALYIPEEACGIVRTEDMLTYHEIYKVESVINIENSSVVYLQDTAVRVGKKYNPNKAWLFIASNANFIKNGEITAQFPVQRVIARDNYVPIEDFIEFSYLPVSSLTSTH